MLRRGPTCRGAVRGGVRVTLAPRRGYAKTSGTVARAPRAHAAPSLNVVCASRSPAPAAVQNLRTVAPRFASIHPPHTLAGMPSLSPTMTTGTIVSWKKNEGDKVKAGDVIAEIETDKAAVAFEYQDDAYLAKILFPKGTSDVAVGVPIAVMVDKAEDVAKFKDFKADAPAAPKPAAAAAPAPAAPSAPTKSTPSAPAQAPAAASAAPSAGGRVIASPLAKSLARESGIDLHGVAGTGPGGRIVAADVKGAPRGAAASSAVAASAPSKAQAASLVTNEYTDVPNTNIRRVIAARLSQSKQTIPHYYLTIDARVDKLQKLRGELNGKGDAGFKLSVNDFVIKAAALACKKVPEANSSWTDQAVRRFHNVHVNVAVATEQGLLTPVVRDADRSGLSSISNAVRKLADKAKAGKLTPMDLEIGTFTISNLGMFGIKNFSAVILPPQACILAVGTMEKRLIPSDAPLATGDDNLPIATANFMSFTLSCDHRVVDGAVGAEWLKAFKELVEDPVKMLL